MSSATEKSRHLVDGEYNSQLARHLWKTRFGPGELEVALTELRRRNPKPVIAFPNMREHLIRMTAEGNVAGRTSGNFTYARNGYVNAFMDGIDEGRFDRELASKSIAMKGAAEKMEGVAWLRSAQVEEVLTGRDMTRMKFTGAEMIKNAKVRKQELEAAQNEASNVPLAKLFIKQLGLAFAESPGEIGEKILKVAAR